MRTTIDFWKNNRIDRHFDMDVEDIIDEYFKSDYPCNERPFERTLLNFMALELGTYEKITDAEWDALHEAKKDHDKKKVKR